jgi:membrane-associated phospholipid phosphatase
MSKRRARELGAWSAVATALFGATALLSATRASAHADRMAAPRLALRPRSRARRVAERLSVVGKWYTLVPAGVVAGAAVGVARRSAAAGVPIAASAISAAVLAKVFDRVLPQPPVPANHRHEPHKAVFPSGHGLLGTATSLTAAYISSREELADGAIAIPIAALFSLANPALKLGVRKHWPTDAIGGVAAGVAIAAACCAIYEALRPEPAVGRHTADT